MMSSINDSLMKTGDHHLSGAFHSPLSTMPLNLDGTLSTIGAPSSSQQSQGMISTSFPRLENFLGNATMSTHQYESGMYYHRENVETQKSLDIFHQQPFTTQQEMQYFSGLTCQNTLYQTSSAEESRVAQIPDWITAQLSSQNISSGVAGVGSMCCGDLQSLSLSMSPGSQSSCVTASMHISPTGVESLSMVTKKKGSPKMCLKQPTKRKSLDSFGQRTSQYRGVTRHRWTGRYEAHLWDNSCKKEGQTRKGRQVYLGGYDMEEKAARAYDCAALKYWGHSSHINFPLDNYQQQLEEMKNMSRQEYVAHLRRRSSGFSRGASMYRGVTRHHQHGKWQARIGRVAGNKDLYLGTFSTQEDAAEAYDIAAIKFRGVNAVTNFDITRYDLEKIIASDTLLGGELARRNKVREPISEAIATCVSPTRAEHIRQEHYGNGLDWKMVLDQFPHQQNANLMEEPNREKQNSINCKSYPLSTALQNLIGINESMNSSLNESTKLSSQHFPDPSSVVTSLTSSREGSTEKFATALNPFAKPSIFSSLITSSQSNAAQISKLNLPGFAAWNSS